MRRLRLRLAQQHTRAFVRLAFAREPPLLVRDRALEEGDEAVEEGTGHLRESGRVHGDLRRQLLHAHRVQLPLLHQACAADAAVALSRWSRGAVREDGDHLLQLLCVVRVRREDALPCAAAVTEATRQLCQLLGQRGVARLLPEHWQRRGAGKPRLRR
jgi:hypothetical protein